MTYKQALCGFIWDHGGDGGQLKIGDGRLWTVCHDCGYISPGVTVTRERDPPTPCERLPWVSYILRL